MSVTTPGPTAADASSLSAVRQLFERKMLDRAIAVAESRWPGSGQMIALADDWVRLSPSERRARLSAIGPEDLARLRRLAELQPDLARVLDDLESRGVLPPVEQLEATTASTEEIISEAAANLSEQALRDASEVARERIQPIAEQLIEAESTAAAVGVVADQRWHTTMVPMPQSEMPVLDLGLPSTDEFMAAEAEHRVQQATAADATLERVRARLERSRDVLLARADAQLAPDTDRMRLPGAGRLSPTLTRLRPATEPMPEMDTNAAQLDALAQRMQSDVVVVLDSGDLVMSTNVLDTLAFRLGLDMAEFTLEAGRWREVLGGLERNGQRVAPVPGPLPRALADGTFVIVRGRIPPVMQQRWQEGFCDIPGTRATVKIHPRSRILLLPRD